MGLLEKVIIYLIIALGAVIFLKLSRRLSILSRLMISIVSVLILLFLFLFISTIIVVGLVIILVFLLVAFLERKRFRFFSIRRK